MASVQRSGYIDKTDKSEHLLRLAGSLSQNLEQNVARESKRKAIMGAVLNKLATNSRFRGTSGAEATVDEQGTIQGNENFDKLFKGGNADLSQAGYNKISSEVFNKENIDAVNKMEAAKRARLNPIDEAQNALIDYKKERGEPGLTPSQASEKQLGNVTDATKKQLEEISAMTKKQQEEAAKWDNLKEKKDIDNAFNTIIAGEDQEEKVLWEQVQKNEDIKGDDAKKMAYINLVKQKRDKAAKDAQAKQDVQNAKDGVKTTRTEKEGQSKGGGNSASTRVREEASMSRTVNDTNMELINAKTVSESQQRMNDEIKTDLTTLTSLETLADAGNLMSGATTNAFTGLRNMRERFLDKWNNAGPKTAVSYEKGNYKIAGGSAKYDHASGANNVSNIYNNVNNSSTNKSAYAPDNSGAGPNDKIVGAHFTNKDGKNSIASIHPDGTMINDVYGVSSDFYSSINSKGKAGKMAAMNGNDVVKDILDRIQDAAKGTKADYIKNANGEVTKIVVTLVNHGRVIGKMVKHKTPGSTETSDWNITGYKGENYQTFMEYLGNDFKRTGENTAENQTIGGTNH